MSVAGKGVAGDERRFSDMTIYAAGLDINGIRSDPGTVSLADANATILAVNSGKTHLIANVSADRTFTLPPVADAAGCTFRFEATVGAADGHDWIFATDATDELFAGGVLAIDSDATPTVADVIVADQSDDDRFQVNVPEGGTWVTMTSNGTFWIVTGTVLAAAFPAFS